MILSDVVIHSQKVRLIWPHIKSQPNYISYLS